MKPKPQRMWGLIGADSKLWYVSAFKPSVMDARVVRVEVRVVEPKPRKAKRRVRG